MISILPSEWSFEVGWACAVVVLLSQGRVSSRVCPFRAICGSATWELTVKVPVLVTKFWEYNKKYFEQDNVGSILNKVNINDTSFWITIVLAQFHSESAS